MEIVHREVKLSRRHSELKIVAMGCVHHGAAGCDDKLAQFWYDKILQEPDTYAIFGGDMVDGIHEKDKRFTHQECAKWCFDGALGGTVIDRQYRYALKKWRPLAEKGKILWLHAGNHEELLWHRFGAPDLTRNWAWELKIPYAGYSALSSLTIHSAGNRQTRHRVTFYSTHGSGSASTNGAAERRVKKLMDAYAADVYLMWHVHRRVTTAARRIGLTQQRDGAVKMREYDRIGAACGTFLNSHMEGITGYGELAGYEPVIPGPVIVHIKEGANADQLRIWASTAVIEQ